MNRKGYKGSITVFLSLASILFLSLICAVVESARVQGAKAQTANITGMGTFSVLGEFEGGLLEKYNIFSLDGSYGSGSFQIQKVNQQLQNYISYNANPGKDLFSPLCFDPWRLELTDSGITGYTLLTDEKGEPFYQQAVAYMKENAAVLAIDKLLEYTKDIDQIQKSQDNYENSQRNNEDQLSGLEEEKQNKIEELESEAAGGNQTDIVLPGAGESETATVPAQPTTNPLTEIAKLRKKSTLDIVTWDKQLSEKKIKSRGFPSGGVGKKGNMKIEKKHSGLVSDVLFREYLLMYFPSYLGGGEGKALDYQIEYILGGKNTDQKNLKYVVNRLLLMREGMNYLYCTKTPQISSEAEALAVALTGFLGIPPLVTATKHALLLAWAYGESLVDVRILLDNGKVPLFKDASTWSLSLENLGRINEVLRQGSTGSNEGMTYPEYLRILLNMGKKSSQKMRALDMIQAELQEENGTAGFKAENGIVAVKADTRWSCRPVFYSLPKAVLGVSAGSTAISQQSSMTY